jgi:hypothetical protein
MEDHDIPTMSDSGSSHPDSPPDWSQFSSLWDNDQPQNVKLDPATFDFGLNLPLDMDLDFDPSSLAIDPSALHFDPKMFVPTNRLDSFPTSANTWISTKSPSSSNEHHFVLFFIWRIFFRSHSCGLYTIHPFHCCHLPSSISRRSRTPACIGE